MKDTSGSNLHTLFHLSVLVISLFSDEEMEVQPFSIMPRGVDSWYSNSKKAVLKADLSQRKHHKRRKVMEKIWHVRFCTG